MRPALSDCQSSCVIYNGRVTTGIIDYGAGNLRSVHKAVEALHYGAKLVTAPHHLEGVDALILPGVGSFGDCVSHLREQGLWEPLRAWVREDRPYLGICLGYQILFESSEESPGVEGLAAFPGTVVRFSQPGLKVPHMGWNQITPVNPADELWRGLPAQPYVYFVHSYFPRPKDAALVSSTADYGGKFAASIRSGNVVAMQFHPEKSQQLGLSILGNFLASVPVSA